MVARHFIAGPPSNIEPLNIAEQPDLTDNLAVVRLTVSCRELPKLTYWLYKLPVGQRYKTFELKRWGDRPPRIIEAPIKPIKEIQRRALGLLTGQYRRHYAVHGYVNGKNIVTNARVHVRQQWVLRIQFDGFKRIFEILAAIRAISKGATVPLTPPS